MTHAYPETLLADVRSRMADMIDYAVYDMKMDVVRFYSLFLASGYCPRIERGDKILALGLSGIELAQRIVAETTGATSFAKARKITGRTPEYWAGWIIASYQWYSNRTFREIDHALPIDTVVQMYATAHEAPEERFFEAADVILSKKIPETRLKRIRTAFGCSQAELAAASGVGLRSIQMYEQRRKNINRAAGDSLRSLSRALGCSVDDILEP